MTDNQTLFNYRIVQAEETISDAKKMLENQLSPRSIINRTYNSMFYAVLAIFIKTDINVETSKHSGIISIFDKEFVHTGKLAPHYSKLLHKAFKARQEGDYKELVKLSLEDAIEFIKLAEEFLDGIKNLIAPIS